MADESSSWLIQRSRECLSVGDNDGADAWIFTATSLYPHSFPVQVNWPRVPSLCMSRIQLILLDI